MGVDLQTIQAWMLVASSSKFYTVSTVLFHKYVGANVAVKNCMSHFLHLSQPRSPWNWLMETRYMPKELVIFFVAFLTVPLYIQWNHFIIFHVNLPTPSHQVPSNFMLDFKKVTSEPLEHCNFIDPQGRSWV